MAEHLTNHRTKGAAGYCTKRRLELESALREAEAQRDTYKMQAEYRLGQEWRADRLQEQLDAERGRVEMLEAWREKHKDDKRWTSRAVVAEELRALAESGEPRPEGRCYTCGSRLIKGDDGRWNPVAEPEREGAER